MFAVVAAVLFGMLAAGCGKDDNPSGGGGTSGLNGTWISEEDEMVLNNGSFEIAVFLMPGSSTSVKAVKGTYTTSGGSITLTPTHIHGDLYTLLTGGMIPLSSKWYTQAELIAAILDAMGDFFDEEDLEEMTGEDLESTTGTYVLSGNTLKITIDGETQTYTRK